VRAATSYDDLPLALKPTEAFSIIGVGRDLGYQLIREGKIPALRLGHRLVVPKAGLIRLLEEAGEVRREAG